MLEIRSELHWAVKSKVADRVLFEEFKFWFGIRISKHAIHKPRQRWNGCNNGKLLYIFFNLLSISLRDVNDDSLNRFEFELNRKKLFNKIAEIICVIWILRYSTALRVNSRWWADVEVKNGLDWEIARGNTTGNCVQAQMLSICLIKWMDYY